MTTATAKKTVEAKWTTKQIQEAAAGAAAANCLAAMEVLSKYGDKAVEEYKTASRKFRVTHLKSLGVKTPAELAQALSEFEANVFGSKIEVATTDKSATMTYQACGMWNAIKEIGKLTPEQEEKMGEGFQTCMSSLAKDLHLTATTEMEGETCTVTFTK